MTSGNLGARRARTHLSPQQVVEELAALIRDLQELLESYAPTWYTQEFDTRVRETLSKFASSTKPSQRTTPP
jgi:hypothetical protein